MTNQLHTEAAKANRLAARSLAKSVDELMKSATVGWPTTQKAIIRKRLEDKPESCRAGYLRAMEGKSVAAAVKSHCLECVSWVRPEVTRCTGVGCAMWPYRPFQEEPADATP